MLNLARTRHNASKQWQTCKEYIRAGLSALNQHREPGTDAYTTESCVELCRALNANASLATPAPTTQAANSLRPTLEKTVSHKTPPASLSHLSNLPFLPYRLLVRRKWKAAFTSELADSACSPASMCRVSLESVCRQRCLAPVFP